MGLSYSFFFLFILLGTTSLSVDSKRHKIQENGNHNYADALTKSILFYEGQRSGKLPASQRMKWRKDSALRDGSDAGVDLTGGYYDAGDNVKYNFPMAFSTTLLAWSVIEYGNSMGSDLEYANEAIRWATDYFIKSTNLVNKKQLYVQVGNPYADHNCWERPEDMDTDRITISISDQHPGSEVSAEMAAALAASSIALKASDPTYSQQLLTRSIQVFSFANRYRGSYNDSDGQYVCPFYCDYSGYQDELVWSAFWLYKATSEPNYLKYAIRQSRELGPSVAEFGWDDKRGGIYVSIASEKLSKGASDDDPFVQKGAEFVCAILPESPTRGMEYSPGGLMFRPAGSNMQHVTAVSFLLLTYSRYLGHANRVVKCGDKTADAQRLVQVAKGQVDYILGNNPMQMSYIVGYGNKYPQRIHHRASSLPSLDQHPEFIGCKDGSPYFNSEKPNPNELTGALVGGPYPNDTFPDIRQNSGESEPTTYINAPLVGLLAYFSNPK